jgi:hypothetical protein
MNDWWSLDEYGNAKEIESNIPIVKSVTKDVIPEYETTISSDIKSLSVEVVTEASKDIQAIKSGFNTFLDFAKLTPIVIIAVGFIYFSKRGK